MPRQKPLPAPRAPISRVKLWSLRLGAMAGAPAIFFALLELGLRLSGYGYPTGFLLSSVHEGRPVFEQNNQFGWRFFGAQMSHPPTPFLISQTKNPGTTRIFVFGESAAQGDPQPQFGLPRMLEALLSLRHPERRFEVMNAAMVGINSHTILPIARDCVKANGDIWVVYMGNNEVVGPFGAGTIFGPQAPALPLIRASLALKSTRTGQWLDSMRQWFEKPPPEKSEWGGMTMFLENQIRPDDSRMRAVYHHFERNLDDIIVSGWRAGVGIVLGTVAVNLADCAPFGSAHSAKLSKSERSQWDELFRRGAEAQLAGNNREADTRFREAAHIDDSFAALHFCEGRCALALGQTNEAQRHFRAARDLDTLRFRCDTRLNELIRQAALYRRASHVLLADAEKAFADHSANGLPGNELFYEHVHLTFEGNYLLSRTVAEQVETLLPRKFETEEMVRYGIERPWPSVSDCARRLAWTDWNRLTGLTEVFNRLNDPPFTGQLDHDSQMGRVRADMESLASAARPESLASAQSTCEEALTLAPSDPLLHAQLATLEQSRGDLPGAGASARRVVELLPCGANGWSQLGGILVQQRQFEEAAAAFLRAFQLDSQDVWSLQNYAQSLAKLGHRDEAMREYKRALSIKPRFGLAWLGLGQLLEEMGRKAEAEECFRKALANRIHRASELATLARFCRGRGWLEAAATNYIDALKLNPADTMLHLEAGQSMGALGRRGDAELQFAEAVRLSPALAQAHFLYGLEFGRDGKAAEAAAQFSEAVRLMPELLEARMNLGIALMQQGHNSEALAQFEEVLHRNPTNALALRYTRLLQGKPSPEQGR